MLDQKGSTGTAELIIVMILLMAITFGGVDYWLMLNQYQQAEHLKTQYLDTVRLNGCLDDTKKMQLTDKLEKLGFADINIYVVDANDPSIMYSEGNRAVRRISCNIEDIPEIAFIITGRFKEKRFWISDFLGGNNEKEDVFVKLQGVTYTEYVERGDLP